jgi:hypothetical protein
MVNNQSLLYTTHYRSFSKKNDNSSKKDDDYSSAFDDLVNKGGVSKEEKAKFD